MDGRRKKLLRTVWIAVVAAVCIAAAFCGSLWYCERRQAKLDMAIAAAARDGRFEEVVRLLERGADPNGPTRLVERDGKMWRLAENPPLADAIKANRFDIAKRLIEAGASFDIGLLQWDLIEGALCAKEYDLIEWLFENGLDPNTPAYRWAYGFVHLIADFESRPDFSPEEMRGYVELALRHGADINLWNGRRPPNGLTPLYVAARDGSVEFIRFLLDHGADVSFRSRKGLTAMDLAAMRGEADVIDALRAHGAPYTIQEAVALNRIGDVRAFLAEDASCLTRSFALGDSLLGIALHWGHHELAVMLLEAGSDIHHRNDDGGTLLHRAAEGDDAEMIARLLDMGMTVDSPDAGGDTPLSETCWHNSHRAARTLLAAGAVIDGNREPNDFAINAACSDAVDVLRLLLEAGSDPNDHVPGEMPPLAGACYYSDSDTVPESARLLVEAGADVNMPGYWGMTPLHCAVRKRGGVPLVQYLLAHGAAPSLVDDQGRTAIDIAREDGKQAILELLLDHTESRQQAKPAR